jgi:hypothetical protein
MLTLIEMAGPYNSTSKKGEVVKFESKCKNWGS